MTEVSNRVLLVDDHPVTRAGLARLLESDGFIVAGEATGGEEACRLYRQLKPDVVLMDISMPGMNGVEALRRIRQCDPRARVVILSMYDSEVMMAKAIAAGALGYLTKHTKPAEILQALHDIIDGKTVYSTHMMEKILESARKGVTICPIDRLSARELEVFRLLVEGKTVKDVAHILCISPKTAGVHHARVKQKLGAGTSVQLVHLAIQYDVLFS